VVWEAKSLSPLLLAYPSSDTVSSLDRCTKHIE
jgi:hypothetical protein